MPHHLLNLPSPPGSPICTCGDHLSMLSTQFLASCLRQSHPSHAVVASLPGPRSMKSTLQSKFITSILPHLIDGVLDPSNYRAVIRQIHTQAVSNTISSLNENPLLGTLPPPISPSETRLTRAQRTTLAQLRSGHCKLLAVCCRLVKSQF